MEFSDNLVQFNIFEAMKHPTEDPSLFGMDIIDELVDERIDEISNSGGDTTVFNYLGSIIDEADYDKLWELHNLSNSEDDIADLVNLGHEAEFFDLFDQVCKYEELECSKHAKVQVAETKKPLQVEGDSVKETKAESNLSIQSKAESYSNNEAEAESISDNGVQNLVPSRFDFNVKRKAKSDSNNQTGAESNSANLSRKQPKAKIMSTHLAPNLH
ncbi:hypothetical protein CR513_20271, partial [Mucuna pruriens]